MGEYVEIRFPPWNKHFYKQEFVWGDKLSLSVLRERSSITSAGFPKCWTPNPPESERSADVILEHKVMTYTTRFR